MFSRLLSFSALTLAAAFLLPAQTQIGPFVPGNYTIVRETRLTATLFEYEARLTIANQGAINALNVVGTATSNHANVTILPAANTLQFGDVAGTSTKLSTNTFRFRLVRTTPFAPSMINWSFTAGAAPPSASAGPNQTVNLGDLVTLNSSGSTDPNGLPLTREWSLQLPSGCAGIILSNPAAVSPTFPANCVGNFLATLTVRNSLNIPSAPATVAISTNAVAPTANAGPNQAIQLTQAPQTVMLNGSGSTSPGNLPLTYNWSLLQRPTNSNAALNNTSAIQPTFQADQIGLYRFQLVVNNGFLNSAPSIVEVSTANVAPTANAGPNQSATINSLIQLNGSGSTDPNSLPLTYNWSITTAPNGNIPALSNPNAVNPTFTLATTGTYIAQLIVCNPFQCSAPSTVTISTQLLAPTANPGAGQTVNLNQLVNLSGLASIDPQSLPLTYQWTLIQRPNTSNAQLNNTASATPSFTPDRHGDYQIQLIVSNGTLSSSPATVLISTIYVPPSANAGLDQNVFVNDTVSLTSAGSQSFSGFPLTFTWSFNSQPPGSALSFANPNAPNPTFVPTVAGTYVIQLMVNDSIQSRTDTVQINVALANSISVNLPATLTSFTQANGTVTLANPAGTGGQTVNLAGSGTGTATIPSSVVVPQGNNGANFPITGGVTAGPYTVTGSASGFASGQATTNITNRTLSVTVAQPIIFATQSFSGTVTLTEPAPTGGVTINLASDNPAFLTVAPTSVNIPAGSTTANFNYTGVANGPANINASAAGFITNGALVTVSGSRVQLPVNFSLNLGATLPLPIALSTAAPAGGATITLTPSSPNIVISPNTVLIPAGATQPAALPNITGNGLGQFSVTATAPGFAPDTQNVTVNLTISLDPATTTIVAGQTRDITVGLSAPAPAGGLTVNVTGLNSSVATAPATVSIPAGQTSGLLTVTAVAAGSTSANFALPANSNTAVLNVTVNVASPVQFIGQTTLGRNGQEQISFNLGASAPPAGVTATISTTSPNILLSTTVGAAGSSSVTLSITPNATTACCIYVQNVNASAGTGSVRFEADGYATVDQVFTFAPSGFLLEPATINTATSAAASNLTLSFRRLDASNAVQAVLNMRGGYSESVTIANPTPAVATVTSPLTFSGPNSQQGYNGVVSPQAAGGTTTLTVTQPSGYATPTTSQTTTVNVANRTLTLGGTTIIGRNQQGTSNVQLSNELTEALNIQLSVDPAAPIRLSTSPTVAGGTSISLTIPPGNSSTPSFYIQNINADSGQPVISLSTTNPLVQNVDHFVTLAGSGFYTWSNSSTIINMNVGQAPETLQLYFATVNTTNNAYIQDLPIRGGLSLQVGLASSPTGIVTLPANVTFNSNTNAVQSYPATVTPAAVGSTLVSAVQPSADYRTNVTYPGVTVNITNNRLTWSTFNAVGYDQVRCTSVSFSPAVPAGGGTLTISGPNSVAFSTVGTVAGTNPLVVNVGPGAASQQICVHNIQTSTGSAAITASFASSITFADGLLNLPLWPSGFYPWPPSISLETTNTTGTSLTLYFAMVNPTNNSYFGDFPLRPGAGPRTVPLLSSNTNSVVVPASVTWADDGSATTRTYANVIQNATPPLGGTSNITIPAGGGQTTNVTYNTSVVTVSVPIINLANCFQQIGFNLQISCPISFAAVPSARTLTLSTSDPSLLISTNRDTVGSQSLPVNLTAGATSVTIFLQSLASTGTVTLSASMPAYQTATRDFNLNPSGFYAWSSGTVRVGQDAQISVYSALLQPGTFARITEQPVRAGVSYTINLQSSNPTVTNGTPLPSFTMNSTTGNFSGFTAVRGNAVGTTVLSPIQPAGHVQTPTYTYVLTVNP